jgi:hypothetical protein
MHKDYLESAKLGKRGKGQAQLIKYLSGERITQREAIKAKCYDCNGMGESIVCDSDNCSLFPYSPYNTVGNASSETSVSVESTVDELNGDKEVEISEETADVPS